MKKIVIILAVFLISITTGYAQHLKPNSLIKTVYHTYEVDSLSSKNLFVYNNKNIYHQSDRRPSKTPDIDNLKKDRQSTINLFRSVFNDERLHQLLNEKNIGVEYVIADSGKILEVSFLLKANTIITGNELGKLEDGFKNEVTYKWNSKHKKIDGFYILFQNISFSKILDGTLPE